MGLTLDYFYSLTPRAFHNVLQGYRAKREADHKLTLESMRNIMWAVLSPHQRKGTNLTPQKLMPFEWDIKELEIRTPEQQRIIDGELDKTRDFWEWIDKRRGVC